MVMMIIVIKDGILDDDDGVKCSLTIWRLTMMTMMAIRYNNDNDDDDSNENSNCR